MTPYSLNKRVKGEWNEWVILYFQLTKQPQNTKRPLSICDGQFRQADCLACCHLPRLGCLIVEGAKRQSCSVQTRTGQQQLTHTQWHRDLLYVPTSVGMFSQPSICKLQAALAKDAQLYLWSRPRLVCTDIVLLGSHC